MEEQFTYRELSDKLNINLAKLKRWGREFLPPDPMAGQSQGVARILTIDEAFILFVSGHLVSGLKYSIPETKIIMELLLPYLKAKKAMPSTLSLKELAKNRDWTISIVYYPESHMARLLSEVCVKTIRRKEVNIPHKDLDIFRSRVDIRRSWVEEQKIFESVAKSSDINAHFCRGTDLFRTPVQIYKYIGIGYLMVNFLQSIRGNEVMKDWVRHIETDSETLVFPDKE